MKTLTKTQTELLNTVRAAVTPEVPTLRKVPTMLALARAGLVEEVTVHGPASYTGWVAL